MILAIDSGAQIGVTYSGNAAFDFGPVEVTPADSGEYFILAAPKANNNGLTDSGLVRLVTP